MSAPGPSSLPWGSTRSGAASCSGSRWAIARARPFWRQAGDLRCSRGANQGDPPPASGKRLAASHRKVRLVISIAFTLPATCCSASPTARLLQSSRLARAWSPPACAGYLLRKPLLRSSPAGTIWPPRWRSATPSPLHCRRIWPEAIA